jgi:hypothetical protein
VCQERLVENRHQKDKDKKEEEEEEAEPVGNSPIASTNLRVAVAIPDMRCIKLRATKKEN